MNTFTTGLRKTSSLLSSMNRRTPYNLRSLTSEKNDKKIVNDKKNQMFYIDLNGDKAVIEYERPNMETFRFIETIVPEAYRGQGIAGELATEVFDYVLENNMKMILVCDYLQAFYKKNQSKYKAIHIEEKEAKNSSGNK